MYIFVHPKLADKPSLGCGQLLLPRFPMVVWWGIEIGPCLVPKICTMHTAGVWPDSLAGTSNAGWFGNWGLWAARQKTYRNSTYGTSYFRTESLLWKYGDFLDPFDIFCNNVHSSKTFRCVVALPWSWTSLDEAFGSSPTATHPLLLRYLHTAKVTQQVDECFAHPDVVQMQKVSWFLRKLPDDTLQI